MAGLLEVIALHVADAARAEEGGADRIEVVGSMDSDGLSAEPSVIEQMRDATSIQIRPMLRLREGSSTDGGELVRLRGLAAAYLDAGADGIVMGYLNGHAEVDVEVIAALVDGADWPWTFHRAVDSALDTDKAWRTLLQLPGLDQVLTAGSARDVDHGLDELLQRCRENPEVARRVMAGGGLQAEHVPWLARAGVRSFHVGRSVRPTASWKAYVDPALVRSWRDLIDSSVSRAVPAQ